MGTCETRSDSKKDVSKDNNEFNEDYYKKRLNNLNDHLISFYNNLH